MEQIWLFLIKKISFEYQILSESRDSYLSVCVLEKKPVLRINHKNSLNVIFLWFL